MDGSIGVVVPTLGLRPELLIQCLESIRNAGECLIAVVAPHDADISNQIDKKLFDFVIPDPGTGLAGAINAGIFALPMSVEFCNWLGDDDLLEPQSLVSCRKALENDLNAALVFGNCTYMSVDGNPIWKSAFGVFAAKIIRFGPCLIPQPGSLFRRSSFEVIGGLDTKYGWAFDYDLFIRLSKIGKLIYISEDTAKFRWHSDSLTVSQRRKSIYEASKVRMANRTKLIGVFLYFWELILREFTYHAPKLFKLNK